MAVILIDDGIGTGDFELPRNFPYPLSFAIPADAPNAPDLMAKYRAQGSEVLALVDLPDGATPQDAETAAAGWFLRMDQVVAIMEGPAKTLQSNRDISEQVAEIVAESGHGLVLYPDGLDTAQKMAARLGVPAKTLFRDLDGEGQGAAVIRRFLDNAAFRAGQEGAVILVARLRPDTVSALLLWGLADRASRVAMAPVSYALKQSTQR